MRLALTIVFWLLFVCVIHMVVFVISGKTVADNLGFIGVMAHAFGSLYLARLAARKITEKKTPPSDQLVSVAEARPKAEGVDSRPSDPEADAESQKRSALDSAIDKCDD